MLTFVTPDMLLPILALLVLSIDLFIESKNKTAILFDTAAAGVLLIIVLLFNLPHDQEFYYLTNYKVDGLRLLFKEIFAISLFFTILLGKGYARKNGNWRGILKYDSEFIALLIFCAFGMFCVVSAQELITLFIGLELATIPMYFLTAYYKKDQSSLEGAMKYIIMGSLTSALVLLGYSFWYGAVGCLRYEAILSFVQTNPDNPMFLAGAIFVFAAVCFKLAMVPFHMWAPDVYQAAPTPVTAFLSVASKSTAIAFVITLLYGPLAPIRHVFTYPLGILACITMTVGNLGAMRQYELRRFMAYSSIAQAGYIMLALVGNGKMAVPSIIYYLFIYLATNFCLFFIISVIGQKRPEEFASLRGLAKQSPALAGILVLCLFSLAGIPPLAGFTGKFMLFASAAEGGFYGLVIFAALNSTVSLYYYLLLIKEAYINKPEEDLESLEITFTQSFSIAILTLAVVILGLIPWFSSIITKIVG